jgi:hypothetical protein
LSAVHVFGGYLVESFWPSVWRSALEQRTPPSNVCMRDLRASDFVDTHPGLRERLLALRAGEVDVAAPAVNAGEALLGSRWAQALQDAGDDWLRANEQAWKEQHEWLSGTRSDTRS